MAGRAKMFGAKHAPRFFKVIVHGSLSEGRLIVPKKFVIQHGKDLPDLVVLKVRTGAEWQIGIIKSDGQVWLEKGWQEFGDHYSLVYGCFVFFEYKDNSHFNVLIFDQKGVEIKYYPPRSSEEPGEKAAANQSLNDGRADIPANRGGGPMALGGLGSEPVSVHGEDTAVESDNAYKPKVPSFKMVMRKTYINNYFLMIPQKFARRHFKGNAGCVIIKVSDGNAWLINYKNEGIQTRFYGGWGDFVRDNNLDVGDHCVFKLVKGNEIITLEVTISRSGEDRNLNPSIRKLRKPIKSRILSNEGLRELQNFTSKDPSFIIVLLPTHVKLYSQLIIPFKFAKTHLKDGKGISMTLEVLDKSWKVTYSFNRSLKYCRITSSWRPFTRFYSLKSGDGLAFELIKSNVLKVTIFRT